MQRLIQSQQLTEDIISKIGRQFTIRFGVRQQFSLGEFNDDSTRMFAELTLYFKSIKQMRSVGNTVNCGHLEQCLQETTLKVINCLIDLSRKHLTRLFQVRQEQKLPNNKCEQCDHNFNAKKIEIIRRQMIDNRPNFIFDEQTSAQSMNQYWFQQSILSNDEIIQKMLKLQRNLQNKQQGLIRCIDQFQIFRTNMMIGQPKYNDQDIKNTFNCKDYAFQMGKYFANHLQHIQDKINKMKIQCKITEDKEVQCQIDDQKSQENQIKMIVESTRASNNKAESEIRRVNEKCHLMVDEIKAYTLQIKYLTSKLSDLDQQNADLRQQIFFAKRQQQKSTFQVQQLKQNKNNNTINNNNNNKYKTIQEQSFQIDFANEVLAHFNDKKTEIQVSGTNIEEVLPIIKSTFKKAVDHFLLQRIKSDPIRKKIKLEDQQESFLNHTKSQNSQHSQTSKKNRGSTRNLAVPQTMKKQFSSKTDFGVKDRKSVFRISQQLDQKITNIFQRNENRVQTSKDQLQHIQKQIRDQKENTLAYKRSHLQTEGNHLKKRGLHIKLSSINSDTKDKNVLDSANKFKKSVNTPQNKLNTYNQHSKKGHRYQKSQSSLIQPSSKQFSQLLSESNGQNSFQKRQKSSKFFIRESMTHHEYQNQPLIQEKSEGLMSIKKYQNKRPSIEPHILHNFFDPVLSKQTDINTGSLASQQQSSNQDLHPKIKNIYNRLKNVGKSSNFNLSAESWHPKKIGVKRQPLTLDEISFLTAFFTLMAKSRISNQKLYLQLRQCIIQSSKQTFSITKQENMIKQTIGLIILGHRKCNGKGLCSHMKQFLLAFQGCIE